MCNTVEGFVKFATFGPKCRNALIPRDTGSGKQQTMSSQTTTHKLHFHPTVLGRAISKSVSHFLKMKEQLLHNWFWIIHFWTQFYISVNLGKNTRRRKVGILPDLMCQTLALSLKCWTQSFQTHDRREQSWDTVDITTRNDLILNRQKLFGKNHNKSQDHSKRP